MYVPVSSKDGVAVLTESSLASNPHTNRSSDFATSAVSDNIDTNIHYISPATTVARTEYEGDLDYQQFLISSMYPQEADRVRSPSTSSVSLPCEENTLQRTLAILKPDALQYKDVVLRAINQAGLKILNERMVHLTPEQVSEIYEKFYGTPAFPHMVVSMSISPIFVLSLQAVNAVERWKTMVGPMGTLREEWFFPYSIRTRFKLGGDIPNTLHASECWNDARKENRYFYPRDVQEPLPAEKDKVGDFITTFVRPTLLEGLTEIVRVKPVDPVLYLAEWLLLHNPYQPNFPRRISLTKT